MIGRMTAASETETPALSLFSEIFGVRRDEIFAAAWSFVYFFCVLSSYYIIRPIREEMAVGGGPNTIPLLFVGTFVVTIIGTSIFGWVASRFPRRVFLPWVYLFFIVNMLALTIGTFNHANLRLPIGPLRYLLNSPQMHLWHHAKVIPDKYGVNYGLSLSLWDWIFGTVYWPRDEKGIELGFARVESYPTSFRRHLIEPFRRRPKVLARSSISTRAG